MVVEVNEEDNGCRGWMRNRVDGRVGKDDVGGLLCRREWLQKIPC